MNKEELVSILVVSYNNLQFFKTCLDSILSQTYPYIEIVFSDDCSDEFNGDEIAEYIEKNKKSNIVNYIINRNENNYGTVKNFNTAIKLSSGNYMVNLACDDAFYDPNVINSIVDFYKTNSFLMAVGYLAYYDEKLENMTAYTPIESNIPFINGKAEDCYKRLCDIGSFFPSPGLSYRRELIELYGLYDEDYKISDDYPRFLKLTRCGCRIGFISRFLTKYRAFGVSSANNAPSRVKELYDKDFELTKLKEILPYVNLTQRNLQVNNISNLLMNETNLFFQQTVINGKGIVVIGKNSVFGHDFAPHFKGFHILLQAKNTNSRINIGEKNKFSNDISIIIANDLSIGNNCIISDRVTILDCDFYETNIEENNITEEIEKISIGNNVKIGSGVTILKNVTIGDNCIITAGSVVTENIKENSIVSGNPAKIIGQISEQEIIDKTLEEKLEHKENEPGDKQEK